MKKLRVLMMAEGVTLAHVARPLAIAARWRNEFNIHVAVSSSWREVVEREGWVPEIIGSVGGGEFLRRLQSGRQVYTECELFGYVEDDLRLMRQLAPDVVVGDFRISLAVSARLLKIPYLNICNVYWEPAVGVPKVVPELPMTHLLGVGVSQRLFEVFGPWRMRSQCSPGNKVRTHYGQPVIKDLAVAYLDADYKLYADAAQLYPGFNVDDRRAAFLGAVVWAPPVSFPDWWSALPSGRPLVFVSLGSSGQVAVLDVVLAAIAKINAIALVATAGRVRCHASESCFVADFIPGLEACIRADLVVCNGGSPMTTLALMAGKPVIGIPSNMDQFLNMTILVQQGLGRMLRPERLKTATVSAMMEGMTRNEELTRNCQSIGRVVRSDDRWQVFGDVVRRMGG